MIPHSVDIIPRVGMVTPYGILANWNLSTDATIDESDLAAETNQTIHIAALDPGTTYYWRVDEVEGDETVIEGDVWSFTTIPLEAHFPIPEDGATDIGTDAQLGWTAGKVVIMHDVYLGTDEAAIAARDRTTFKGKLMTASYDPGGLESFTTYYWAVDQFTPTGTVAGPVWSFTTVLEVSIDIKPGSFPNSINPNAGGVIPVAILTTDIFDASTVKPETVALEGTAARGRGKSGNYGSMEDVDADGDLDLVVQIENVIEWDLAATEATLTGMTWDNIPIAGTDSVNIVPPK